MFYFAQQEASQIKGIYLHTLETPPWPTVGIPTLSPFLLSVLSPWVFFTATLLPKAGVLINESSEGKLQN